MQPRGEGAVPRSQVVKCGTLALPLWVLLNVESLSWAGEYKITTRRLEGRPIADQLMGASNQTLTLNLASRGRDDGRGCNQKEDKNRSREAPGVGRQRLGVEKVAQTRALEIL